MAITSLLFSGSLPIESIAFDATISEQHTRDAEVTEHPVETGAAITDHVRLKPDRVQMDCILSNSPLTGATGEGRAEDLYEQLRLLQESATLLTVLTTLRTYESMVIESLGVPRTAKEAGAVHVNLTLKQIRLVQNKTSVVTVTREPIAKKKVGTGKQSATEAADGPQKEKTILKQLSNSVGLSSALGFK